MAPRRPILGPPARETVALAVLFGAATLLLGILPSPLMELTRGAGQALGLL